MGAGEIRRRVQKKFKLRGFTLKIDALDEALSFVARFPDAEDEAVDLLLDEIDKESLKSSIIDGEAIRRVVNLLLEVEAAVDPSSSAASNRSPLRVVDAFLVPRFCYDPIKKVFYEYTGMLSIHGQAGDKAALYRDRYQLLLQRLTRDKYFSRPVFDTETMDSESCEITSIQSLVGCTGRKWLMGVISQLEEEKVLDKLSVVLDGYESVDVVPSLFVLMGNFCSHPCNLSFHAFSSLRMQFAKLGDMIKAHPRIEERSRFLFIPGPDDAGPAKVLPKCTLPKYLTEELQNRVPSAIFSSNPCRVKFYTQEIVFFRQDLLYKMRRSSLIPPSAEETSDPFEHLVATITHQSHLCPLPLTVQPIIWNYDHCLRLYPTPHTIVLGDRSEQKAFKYTGITCFNPGSFSSDSNFAAYRPCTQEVELSALES
ncbi:hypothetical protein HPP92_019162 [Vanilla planifolia]|uniref:DNA polymerase II subunit 2 n=1 Tax=Vanilla planifolia TaxID=51239 RepID=A0A835QEC8_VANPL|nr:hypothetical protein HPP92_019162 [Vanilla planifolia]